jgi:hypothetical protein
MSRTDVDETKTFIRVLEKFGGRGDAIRAEGLKYGALKLSKWRAGIEDRVQTWNLNSVVEHDTMAAPGALSLN